MSKSFPTTLICLLLLLGAGCGKDSVADPSLAADGPVVDADPSIALQNAEVKLEDIPEVRVPQAAPPTTGTVATAEKKKPEWLKASPFYGKAACDEWDGGQATISAACCKYVVANYAYILAAPGKIDVLALMTKDPYLNACKAFNAEFLAAIDKIENPVEEASGNAPF